MLAQKKKKDKNTKKSINDIIAKGRARAIHQQAVSTEMKKADNLLDKINKKKKSENT